MATTKDLTGTYGQSGNNATTDDITGVIRKNSYCAGTRDDELLITTTQSQIGLNSTVLYDISAPANSVIEVVIEVPGQPAVKASVMSEFDPYGSSSTAFLQVFSGSVEGQIKVRIVSFNNYPLVQEAPIVNVTDIELPGTPAEPGIYIYTDRNEVEVGSNFTGTITLTGLVIDNPYIVTFRNFITEEQIVGINDFLESPSFIATAETMSIPFSVPGTVFTNLETQIIATIVSNIPAPPPDAP